ncbi:MAG: hypothetical protein ACI9KE_003707 [Polyangiales bacterium]|jgi:hypothetical protein
MFIVPMVAMLLCVVLLVGCYLPKITGSWATLVVPLAAALGLLFLARRRKPQMSFEAGSLVLLRGSKRQQVRLDNIRFGYARWRTPDPGGLAGTVLVVRDGSTSLTIGGHRFLFDVPARYQVDDTAHSEVHLTTEADYREFITCFEAQVRANQPQSADLLQITSADQSPPEYTFQLGSLWLMVKGGQVALYEASQLVSTTPVAQLRWSAGSDRVGSQHSSYLMPIVALELPDRAPMTIGTYSRDSWTIEAPAIGRPRFFLGTAEWLQLARALGIARHLQAPRRRPGG